MNKLQQITDEMGALEFQLQALNHKYNYDVNQMPANDYIEYENIQKAWDSLKRKRDILKKGPTIAEEENMRAYAEALTLIEGPGTTYFETEVRNVLKAIGELNKKLSEVPGR
jgi:hypothetical protein